MLCRTRCCGSSGCVVVMVVVVSGADQPGMSVGGDYPGLTEVQ